MALKNCTMWLRVRYSRVLCVGDAVMLTAPPETPTNQPFLSENIDDDDVWRRSRRHGEGARLCLTAFNYVRESTPCFLLLNSSLALRVIFLRDFLAPRTNRKNVCPKAEVTFVVSHKELTVRHKLQGESPMLVNTENHKPRR